MRAEKSAALRKIHYSLRQNFLPGFCDIERALFNLSEASVEDRGAVFTRREVVDFILDLVGYTADKPLFLFRLLEPSFGDGDFLLAAIERLLKSYQAHNPDPGAVVTDLANSVCGVELHTSSFSSTRSKVLALLESRGIPEPARLGLADSWLIHGDFLLTPLPTSFTTIVGNPPYVRQERIPASLIAEYRSRFKTIYDRADIYVPFVEKSLSLLAKGGSLGFICSDRWMKNKYGGPLRRMVAESFHLKVYVDMVDTPAFHSDVIAYPAITIIVNERPGPTRIARRPEIDRVRLAGLAEKLLRPQITTADDSVREFKNVAHGDAPWILESSDQLAVIRRMEREFPTIEEAGCKIGIGVATGADDVFIGPYESLDVEPDRKLPLVMTRDIESGRVEWRGFGVINPFADDGTLVDLGAYPRLKRYLEDRKERICRRHVSRKNPAGWYRTIDRIYPGLARAPKLLIPDIKGTAHIVYEDGHLYPHHNLYYIISETWDLKALRAVLLSGIARLFVSVYSTKMRGGYLRFQAQYLRRIRIPQWSAVPEDTRNELIAAAESCDASACNAVVFKLYGLTREEQAALGGGNGE